MRSSRFRILLPRNTPVNEALEIIDAVGVPGLLALVIYGGLKGWWVFGWIYLDLRKDRDEWRGRALASAEMTEKLVENGNGEQT